MATNSIRLHRAKINTLGSRAEDVFWISGTALSQPEQAEALRCALLKGAGPSLPL